MENTVKKCLVGDLQNDVKDLYLKYSFLCSLDEFIFDLANDDFETLCIIFLFFFSSLDVEFKEVLKEFSEVLGEDFNCNA